MKKNRTSTFLGLLTVAWLAALTSASAQSTFTKITTGAIVNDQGQFVRGVWADFNNDGWLDLFVCNWGNRTNVLYRNNGDGSFTKLTQGDPVRDAGYHSSPDAGDYDNDGFLDLVVSSGAYAPSPGRNLLYHNDGGVGFSQVSGGGVTNLTGWFDPLSWMDYDNDGRLDFYVCQDGLAFNQLWHNLGEGTFVRLTSGPLSGNFGGSPTWGDYDNEGLPDLFLVEGDVSSINLLFHNDGNGAFRRVMTNSLATDLWPGGAQAAAWGDFDRDGFQDIFVSGAGSSPDRLYRNNGNGTFTAVPFPARPGGSDSLGCAWGDYDNDGYLDLFVSRHNARNALYHNNGDGTFTQVLSGDPVNDGGPEYSLCGWVDYDNDGFPDLFVSRNNGDVPSVSNLLYHNEGNTNGWLELKLVGTASNHSAIGAKVRVRAVIGGTSVRQMREITGGGGRWMQTLVGHFGLGDATNVDEVRIEWPSGIVQVLTNVAPRQILTVVEHQQTASPPQPPRFTGISYSANGPATISLTGDSNLLYVLEASSNLVNWQWLGARSNSTGTIQFTDPAATNNINRFYRAYVP